MEYAGIACKEMIDSAEYEVNKYLSNIQMYNNASQYYVFDNALIIHASAGLGLFGTSEKPSVAIKNNSTKKSSRSMWQWVKDTSSAAGSAVVGAAGAAVDGAIYVAKEARNTVGYVVDQAGNVVYSGTVLFSALDQDIDSRDIVELVGKEQERQWKNFKEGKSGETFATLQEGVNDVVLVTKFGMEELGELVEDVTIDTIRNTTGINLKSFKGYLPKTMSFMGDIAAGTIGGITSGIANVLSPESTTSDVAKGFIDLVFSFWGGSSNVFKASTAGKAAVAKSGTFVNQVSKEVVKKVEKSGGASIVKAGTNLAKTAGKKANNVLNKVKNIVDDTKKYIFSGNGQKAVSNTAKATDEGAESFFWELVDHITGSHADNVAKGMVGDMFEHSDDLKAEPNALKKYIEETKDGIVDGDNGQQINLSNILDFNIYDDGSFVNETKQALSKVNINGALDWLFGGENPAQQVDADIDIPEQPIDSEQESQEEIAEEPPVSEDGQYTDDLAIEDWVNAPNNENSGIPKGAKYKWVLSKEYPQYTFNDENNGYYGTFLFEDYYPPIDERFSGTFVYQEETIQNGFASLHMWDDCGELGTLNESHSIYRWTPIQSMYFENRITTFNMYVSHQSYGTGTGGGAAGYLGVMLIENGEITNYGENEHRVQCPNDSYASKTEQIIIPSANNLDSKMEIWTGSVVYYFHAKKITAEDKRKYK